MPATYDSIASITTTTNTSTVTFSNLGSYTDLVLIMRLRSTFNESSNLFPEEALMRFNGDSGSNYWRQVWTSGGWFGFSASVATSSSIRLGNAAQSAWASGEFSQFEVYIPQYRNTNVRKIALCKGSTGYFTHDARRSADLSLANWTSTAAITSIDIFSAGGHQWVSNCTFSLYGITVA